MNTVHRYSFREAFALSADEVRNSLPPGTSKLIGHAAHATDIEQDKGTVLLVPQPSQDPADPLNWPFWRKIMLLLVVSMYGFAANFSSAVPAAALPNFLSTFHTRTFSELTRIQAINVLPLGGASIILTPLANCFGRRPIMLIAMAILAFSSLGAAKATTFNGLLIARFFQGFGGSAADTVSPDMVGEVFFVHQGGRGIAVYTTLLALGSIVGGISGGNIAHVYGWPGVFWVSFIMNGIIFLCAIFLMPETMFDRKSRLANEANFISEEADSSSNDKGEVKFVETVSRPRTAIAYPPFTFMQSLKMGTYRGNLLDLFVAPWKTLRFPGVLLMMSLYGVLVAAIVTLSTMGPQFVSRPPYLWGANAGLISFGGLGGLILGAIYTYGVADRIMMILAKRNVSGLAEPETRLPTMLPSIVLGVAGCLIFGFCAEYPAPGRWGGLVVGYGGVSFALLQIPSIGFNYLIQSYNAVSGDCLLMVTLFRALITFTFTWVAADWVEANGAAQPFGIIAMLLGLGGIFVIPQWKYGKRMRLWTAKWLPEKADH